LYLGPVFTRFDSIDLHFAHPKSFGQYFNARFIVWISDNPFDEFHLINGEFSSVFNFTVLLKPFGSCFEYFGALVLVFQSLFCAYPAQVRYIVIGQIVVQMYNMLFVRVAVGQMIFCNQSIQKLMLMPYFVSLSYLVAPNSIT